MTTASESHDAQLAAIKARHEALAAKFNDPAVTRVGPDEIHGNREQMGLSEVLVDRIGRFWRLGPQGAEVVFDPSASRAAFYADGTQAAQGFKAHEEESPVFTAEEISRMERLPGNPPAINRIKAHEG